MGLGAPGGAHGGVLVGVRRRGGRNGAGGGGGGEGGQVRRGGGQPGPGRTRPERCVLRVEAVQTAGSATSAWKAVTRFTPK